MRLYIYEAGTRREASPADIIAAFNELPLPVQLRAAGGAMDRLCLREGWDTCSFGPLGIRNIADEVEREDAEKAHRDTEIEELAQVIRSTTGRLGSWDSIVESAREEYREQARAVLDAGYRRGESAAPSPGLHDCEYDDPRMCAWPGHRKAQS